MPLRTAWRPPTVGRMGRPPRTQIAGAVYHVTTRSAGSITAYRDAADYSRFLRILAYVTGELRWRVHLYCLMPTHWHLVVTTVEANIAACVHVLNGLYARTFNERHGRTGHLFGARYRSPMILTEPHAIRVCSYVPLNPVEAGLVDAPEDWPWSSYAATLGLREKPWFLEDDWALRHFDERDIEVARRRYRSYVEAAAEGVRGARHLEAVRPRAPGRRGLVRTRLRAGAPSGDA
jgi:putative transposase